MARYQRPVSPLERYAAVLNMLYRYHVDGIVEGVGTVDPVRLQDAVDRAAAANPAIRVRWRGVLGWSRWVDSGQAPIVRLCPESAWDGTSEQHSEAFLGPRLTPERGGPVADVLIVPGLDGKTRLVFRTAHAAIDGRGFMHWVAEVCRALRDEPLLGSDSALTDWDIQRAHADRIPEEPPTEPVACIPVLTPQPAPRPALSYHWRRLILPVDAPQLLPRLAVFLAARARTTHGDGPVGFTIPVDFRGLRTQEMGLGNLTGYVRLSVPTDAKPRALMQQIVQRLRAFADCRQIPGLAGLRWVPLWFLLKKLRQHVDAVVHTVSPALPTGGLVSMGHTDAARYDFPGFQADRLYGIPGAVGKLNIVFLNYPDHTVLTVSTPATYNVNGALDELVADLTHYFSSQGQAT